MTSSGTSLLRSVLRGARYTWLLAALLFAACSAARPSEPEVSTPAEEILEGGPTVTNITSTSATLEAKTGLSLICSVAYGATTDYGSLATDRDMDAGGHTDHHPVLTGLEPDTEYHFRFGGLGPDGKFYLSQDYTFHTAPVEEAALAPSGVNIAGEALILEVSSNWNGGDNDSQFGANNAIDGDLGSEWSSDGDGDDAFITLDLGHEWHITGVGFATRTMGSSAEISTFTVTTEEGETFGPFELTGPNTLYYFLFEATTSTLRFDVASSSGGNTGAAEIEVYAEQ